MRAQNSRVLILLLSLALLLQLPVALAQGTVYSNPSYGCLPNNVAGIDVLVDIVPGGRSIRIFVVTDGHGFAIDCEAAVENWSALELSFDGVFGSFKPNLERRK